MADLRIERVVVTGGRKFNNGARIEADLRALLPFGLKAVAQGGARGADGIARAISCRLHDEVTESTRGQRYIETNVYEADWLAGPGAGPRRNIRMLEAERPNLVLAYPDPDSRGTWHCLREALNRGIAVAVWAPWATAEQVLAAASVVDAVYSFNRYIITSNPTTARRLAEVLHG